MTKFDELHARWMHDPAYRAEYERLGPEYEKLKQELLAQPPAQLPGFLISRTESGLFHWVFRDADGVTVAFSHEAAATRDEALKQIEALRRSIEHAPVLDSAA
jgi:uncharacterized protein YegP (UPF0339 family)